MQEEIWKDVPNYEGLYQVSNLGNVKSLQRYVICNGGNRFKKEIILKPGKDNYGYYIVSLHKKCISRTFSIHKLVAITFLNNKPDKTNKIVVDHINNIRTDNRIENLQLISHRENCSKDKKGLSKYKGVNWNKTAKKWQSRISINNKRINLGLFTCELKASIAYNNKLKEINNE